MCQDLRVLRVLTFPEAETPETLRRQVHQMQEQAWPTNGGSAFINLEPIHDPVLRPLTVLLVDDGTVLAALDVLFKEIDHTGLRLFAAGLSTVVTPFAHRGRGYGRIIVTKARERMSALGVDVGLFTCDRPLQAFYESCGWESLPGTILVGGTPDQPFPSDQPGFDKVTLGWFFSHRAVEARAHFLDARVMLHSGDIDKLW